MPNSRAKWMSRDETQQGSLNVTPSIWRSLRRRRDHGLKPAKDLLGPAYIELSRRGPTLLWRAHSRCLANHFKCYEPKIWDAFGAFAAGRLIEGGWTFDRWLDLVFMQWIPC